MSLLLSNARIYDGSGAPPINGDVLIENGKISAVGRTAAPADARKIDCTGHAVAPGFIDAHSHSDLQILENRADKVRQGVTSEVVGNCGFSPFPCSDRAALHEYANGIFCGDDRWGWNTAADYVAEAREKALKENVFPLTGHGSLRIAFAGPKQGRLEARLVENMAASLAEGLAAGSIGFSTGLMYAPGSSAPFDELTRLCSVVRFHDKIYCTHMRSYSWELLESLDEQFEIARASQCKLQISHLQSVGRANWDKQQQAFDKIENARKDGIDVEFDIYPYRAGSTVLTQLLPQSALDGGAQAMVARLQDSAQRKQIATETQAKLAQTWEDVYICAVHSEANQSLVGQNIQQISESRGTEPVETVIDILIEEAGEVNMLSFNQSEPNLRALLTHPLCSVISDGFYVKGQPHPRLFGSFPELLGRCCREKKWMKLEEGIHKMTGKPAQRFGLKDRGFLRPGAWADVTIFDPENIGSPATYDDPEQPPTGIQLVLREGKEVYRAAR